MLCFYNQNFMVLNKLWTLYWMDYIEKWPVMIILLYNLYIFFKYIFIWSKQNCTLYIYKKMTIYGQFSLYSIHVYV